MATQTTTLDVTEAVVLTNETVNRTNAGGRCRECGRQVAANPATEAFPHWLPGVARTESMCTGSGYPVRRNIAGTV